MLVFVRKTRRWQLPSLYSFVTPTDYNTINYLLAPDTTNIFTVNAYYYCFKFFSPWSELCERDAVCLCLPSLVLQLTHARLGFTHSTAAHKSVFFQLFPGMTFCLVQYSLTLQNWFLTRTNNYALARPRSRTQFNAVFQHSQWNVPLQEGHVKARLYIFL